MQDLKFVPRRDVEPDTYFCFYLITNHTHKHRRTQIEKHIWEHKYHSAASHTLCVLLFRHSSFHRLINRIQQATNTEKRVCGERERGRGGSPERDNKDIENKTETRDTQTETHARTHKYIHTIPSYIPWPSGDVSLLFKTQPT